MKFSLPNTTDEDVTITAEISFNGTVWIGDPCYIIPDKDWGAFLDTLWKGDDSGQIIKTPKGYIYVWGTRHGDGEYPVYRDRKEIGTCGVDAGLLCITYYDTAYKLLRNKRELARLGTIVEDVSGIPESSGGNMTIGDITVNTDDEDDE